MEERGDKRQSLGRRGEDAAVRHLRRLGCEILERGYRRLRGEIDIIVRDGGTVVFVEVKTRTRRDFGPPEDAVSAAKQAQVRRIAEAYLAERKLGSPACRFDVVAVESGADGTLTVRHIPDAF